MRRRLMYLKWVFHWRTGWHYSERLALRHRARFLRSAVRPPAGVRDYRRLTG